VSFTGKVLALDLATVTGWAFGAPDDKPEFGSLSFGKPDASRASRYRAFRRWLDASSKADLIVFESPAVPMLMSGKTNIDTVRFLIGMTENLEEWCHDRVELREASVSQVRSYFIGQNMKAKIAKPLTLERCQQLGWMAEDFDQADALALWSYQCSWLRPDLSAYSTPLFQPRARP